MKRVLLFGASDDTLEFLSVHRMDFVLGQIEVLAIADNDSRLKGKELQGIPIIQPEEISQFEFDLLIVTPVFFEEIVSQLVQLGIDKDRVLPYHQNYKQFFDRIERSFGSVKIGRYSYFKPGTKITNTEIGSFCHIGTNCIIGQGGHDPKRVSTYPLRYHFANLIADCSQDPTADKKRLNKITRIGNDVYIGEGVVIFAGISIGHGAVIASKAVVSKDVEDYAIVGGIPAKVIAQRFDKDQIDRLKEISWWNWADDEIAQRIDQFDLDIDQFLAQL